MSNFHSVKHKFINFLKPDVTVYVLYVPILYVFLWTRSNGRDVNLNFINSHQYYHQCPFYLRSNLYSSYPAVRQQGHRTLEIQTAPRNLSLKLKFNAI